MKVAYSKNNVPIRLTYERWVHIIEAHDDLAGYKNEVLSCIEEPDYIIAGYNKALIALKKIKAKKFLAVVYKEVSSIDGFIITAYFTSKIKLEKQKILWNPKKQ